GLLDRFARGDLGSLGQALGFGPLARQLGALLSARDLDFTLLGQTSIFGFPVYRKRQLLGFQVLGADRDQRILLDIVALLLAALDLLGQTGQTLGVELIGRVEVLHRGL